MYCIRHSFFCGALVFFLGLPGSAFSQIADNFSDGDFSQNPTWQGDAASFLINPAGELQLNAAAAGTSLLTVQGNIPDSAVWSLHFRLGFAPSTNNLLRIYLLADLADRALAARARDLPAAQQDGLVQALIELYGESRAAAEERDADADGDALAGGAG